MKRIIIILGVVISAVAIQTVFAQGSGVIVYETQINMHRNIPKEREGMKSMIPEYRTVKNQLFFNEGESIYKPLIEDEEEDMTTQAHGGGGFVMKFQQPNVEIYFNPSEQLGKTSQEFMGKQYLISDSLEMAPWKFGTETKNILGYECRQAFYTTTEEVTRMQVTGSGPPTPEKTTVTRDITAWYTDQLRPFLGPDRYYTLPGAVLAIDINNGERVTVAKNIDMRDLKKNELKVPSKGEQISQSEFEKVREEQMQKMRQQGGGRMMMFRN